MIAEHRAGTVWVVLGLWLAGSAAAQTRLAITGPGATGWPRLSTSSPTQTIHRLEASADLRQWMEIGLTHDAFRAFPDLTSGLGFGRFYRAVSWPRGATDDWKNQLWCEQEPFRSPEPPYGTAASRWVKFAVVLEQPTRVYFQDSTKYLFHYDFAVARLPGFAGMSRQDFDRVALHSNGQQVLLGAVLFAPSTNLNEIGIQFVGLDPYPRERVVEWYRTVRAVIDRPAGVEDFYLPTYEQAPVAAQNAAYLLAQGVRVSSADRWVIADECYAPGWALGRLVFVPAAEISLAYAEGRLGPSDLLLTDTVPAEIPPVAAVIALSPATPNSHVALLATSFGIPFLYFADTAARERLRAWDGQEIALRAVQVFGAFEVRADNLDGQLTPEQRAQILALKAPRKLALTPKTHLGQITTNTDQLHPADIRFVGGKAANFGVLRRAIPDHSPPAIAFTFDLWDAYLDQPLPGGTTLRETIATRLSHLAWPPAMGPLQAELAAIRDLFTDTADFTPDQRQAILAALVGFDPGRNIRFRSSTNVEDTDQFSGAGLYDSFSGCLADDLDEDSSGPCRCDAVEPRERGVFRAMRKVYASFYNDNAFLERLRHSVDESQVGMAILVHHSTPDEFELANGVATLHLSRSAGPRYPTANLITQLGAVSVSNPEAAARPENVAVSSWGATPWFDVITGSSLVPLGGTVMTWDADYHTLWQLFDRATHAYETEFPLKTDFWLDFEYKKVTPGVLRVKQIREVPQPDPGGTLTPFLAHATNRFVVFQSEEGDLLANHRLKSQWQFTVRNGWLVASNLTASVFRSLAGQWQEGTNLMHLDATPESLPDHRFEVRDDRLVDRWSAGAGPDRRTFELQTQWRREVPAAQGPILTLADLAISWSVTYATPQPTLGFGELNATTTNERVILRPPVPVTVESLPQTRQMSKPGLHVETRFYWPPEPKGPVAGYTAPLQAWVSTTIEGLTATPMVLRSEFAQTYHPWHHNFDEEFLFDPFLEPGLDPVLLAELRAENIRALLVSGPPNGRFRFVVWGWDDRFREW